MDRKADQIFGQGKIQQRRVPTRLNVPVPLPTLAHPGSMIRTYEYIPATTNSSLGGLFTLVMVDNETQTGVRYPTDSALYDEIPTARPTFVSLGHSLSKQPHSGISVLVTLNKVNTILYNRPLRYKTAEDINRDFRFLGFVDGIVPRADTASYNPDHSLINMHVGGEGAKKVDNIWLGMNKRQRTGTAVFLILVRKAYPSVSSLHASVLPGNEDRKRRGAQDASLSDAMEEDLNEDGGSDEKRGGSVRGGDVYPPQNAKYYWRFEPYASNELSPWDEPPPSVYQGVGWDGLFIKLGLIKDISGCVAGEKGRYDNDLTKSLYPHEHATHMRGDAPDLPRCTLVLTY